LDEAAACATGAAVIASGMLAQRIKFRANIAQKAGLGSRPGDSHRSEGGIPHPQRRCLDQNIFRASRDGKLIPYASLAEVPLSQSWEVAYIGLNGGQ
jgi:hypothetical protein